MRKDCPIIIESKLYNMYKMQAGNLCKIVELNKMKGFCDLSHRIFFLTLIKF